MDLSSSAQPSGRLSVRKVTAPPPRPSVRTVQEAVQHGLPGLRALSPFQSREDRQKAAWQAANAPHFQRSLADMERWEAGRLRALGQLWGRVVKLDGTSTDLGLMSCRVVTDAGVAFLIDAMQGLVEPELLRFHGLGTGTNAESAANTALQTELGAQYATANTRPTGSLGEKAGDSKTFETSATITVSSSVAATEHGIFTQAATGGGVLLDRSVFAAVNLAAAEALQVTYQLSIPSGG